MIDPVKSAVEVALLFHSIKYEKKSYSVMFLGDFELQIQFVFAHKLRYSLF